MKQQWGREHSAIPIVTRTALALAVAAASLGVQAGKIVSVPSATGAAGFGGWNLDNVEVILNGTGSSYNEETGAYVFGPDSDFTYVAHVDDGDDTVTGYVLAKDWPVGEPSGIKVINDDLEVNSKPENCIMATSYLEDHYLDSADPQQVVCSSGFQTHKRFKVAMLPETVDGTGSESVDLVFNVEAEAGSRNYQIFQKINNWTDQRLQGFTLQVGCGVGDDFDTVAADHLGNLNISVPSSIWSATQLANFSSGLFGPLDQHTGEYGYFDRTTRAGFYIDEYVADGDQPLTHTLTATTTLGSAYSDVPAGAGPQANQFGPWLPNSMLPYGIFFDDDGNPETDAALLGWYGYNPATSALGWMNGAEHGFSAIPDETIIAWGGNLLYTMGEIDDLVNVGLNYVVTVGDVNAACGADAFTIRMTPTADTSGVGVPLYVGYEPEPLLIYSSSDAALSLDPSPFFSAGSLLTARLGDGDLNGNPELVDTVDVTISTGELPDETLTLVEQGANRGVFAAILPAAFSNISAGTITMTYTDADDGTGNSVAKQASTTLDTTDTDADGIPDMSDNCIEVANGTLIPDAGGNSQLDTDGDGYGNICDADLSNDGVVNLTDFNLFRAAFGQSPVVEDADFNGDATVNLSDYSIFRSRFGGAPGPSCCGETD
jgi:hypothetical protein